MEAYEEGNTYVTYLTNDVGWTCQVNGHNCTEGCKSEIEALSHAYNEVGEALKERAYEI